MSLWVCQGCTTAYAVGLLACPQCGSTDFEEDGVAKANPLTGATVYVAEGDEIPADLPPGDRAVGPGAAQDAPAAPEVAEVVPEPEPEPVAVEAVPEPPDPGPPAPATIPGPDSIPLPSSDESSAPDDADADDG